MEENNYPENQEQAFPQDEPKPLIIDAEIKDFLTETLKWTKFLAIIGFVFTGLIVLLSLFFITAGKAVFEQTPLKAVGSFIGAIYLILGALYYFPSKYLYDFSTYAKQALLLNDQESLNYAFYRQKSLYKFWGILIIIMLVVYVVLIAVGIFTAIFLNAAS